MSLSRSFGLEVEFFLPPGTTCNALAAAITARGIDCRSELWNHETRGHWKIVTDRSLGDMDRGREVVSPPLSGETGMAQARVVMDAVLAFGGSINKRCGVHVHVGVGHPPLSFFRNLMQSYILFEPVIDAMLPVSRRGDANGYCKSLTHIGQAQLDQAANLGSLCRLMTSTVQMQRYHKVNLRSYEKYQTVEFRQHHGTLDSAKIEHWTRLCLRMVERAMQGPLTSPSNTAGTAVNPQTPGSKSWQLVELMRRPGGVSGPEAIIAMGWPGGISLSHEARRMGVAVTRQRQGREVRYCAVSAVAAAPVAVDLDGMFTALDCPPAEQAYFRDRTVRMAALGILAMAG